MINDLLEVCIKSVILWKMSKISVHDTAIRYLLNSLNFCSQINLKYMLH